MSPRTFGCCWFVTHFGWQLGGHVPWAMPPRGSQCPAEQIANGLRAVGWERRHLRYWWLCRSNYGLAAQVAELMSPDELLHGQSNGAKLGPIIPLPDRPRPFGEGLSRAVRPRLFLGCAFRTGGCRFASEKAFSRDRQLFLAYVRMCLNS